MKLTPKDLLMISDFATDKMINLSTRSLYQKDNKAAQTYAFTSAVIFYLTSKDLLKEGVEVDENIHPSYIKD